MEEEVEEKIDRKIEQKVDEKLEKVLDGEADSELDAKVKQRLEERLEEMSESGKKSLLDRINDKKITRRNFLKVLGLGAGGLTLSSTAAAGLFKITKPSVTSAVDADTVDGKEASEIGGSVSQAKNYSKTANLSIDNNGNLVAYETSTYITPTTMTKSGTDVDAGGTVSPKPVTYSVSQKKPISYLKMKAKFHLATTTSNQAINMWAYGENNTLTSSTSVLGGGTNSSGSTSTTTTWNNTYLEPSKGTITLKATLNTSADTGTIYQTMKYTRQVRKTNYYGTTQVTLT